MAIISFDMASPCKNVLTQSAVAPRSYHIISSGQMLTIAVARSITSLRGNRARSRAHRVKARVRRFAHAFRAHTRSLAHSSSLQLH